MRPAVQCGEETTRHTEQPTTTMQASNHTDDGRPDAPRGIREQMAQIVEYGYPTCGECRDTDRDDRDDGAEFWPDRPVVYVDGRERSGVSLWFRAIRCPYHDQRESVPDDATHRLECDPSRDTDHHMRSAYRWNVQEVREVTGT